MERLIAEGAVGSGGVSNYTFDNLEHLVADIERRQKAGDELATLPVVLKREDFLSFPTQSSKLIRFCASKSICIIATSCLASKSLGKSSHELRQHGLLTAIGETYRKSACQVALRWALQSNTMHCPGPAPGPFAFIPPDPVAVVQRVNSLFHARENLDIFDFSLTRREMELIRAIDFGGSGAVGPHQNQMDVLIKRQNVLVAVLRNGVMMPVIALDTSALENSERTADLVTQTLGVGYRHISLAKSDDIFEAIGKALKRPIPSFSPSARRSRCKTFVNMSVAELKYNLKEHAPTAHPSVFVTVEISAERSGSDENMRAAIQRFHDKVGVAPTLCLLQMPAEPLGNGLLSSLSSSRSSNSSSSSDSSCCSPIVRIVRAWRMMENLVGEKKIASAGVANCSLNQLEHLIADVERRLKDGDGLAALPVVCKLGLNPLRKPPVELMALCRSKSIHVASGSCLGTESNGLQGRICEHKEVTVIGDLHCKSARQVALRWALDSKCLVSPGASQLFFAKENFDIVDFKLTDKEMKIIDRLHIDEGSAEMDVDLNDAAKFSSNEHDNKVVIMDESVVSQQNIFMTTRSGIGDTSPALPAIGLDTVRLGGDVDQPERSAAMVREAFALGYRHIYTEEGYNNYEALGKALRLPVPAFRPTGRRQPRRGFFCSVEQFESILRARAPTANSSVFVTFKLSPDSLHSESAMRAAVQRFKAKAGWAPMLCLLPQPVAVDSGVGESLQMGCRPYTRAQQERRVANNARRSECWMTMEDLVNEKLISSAGVANWGAEHWRALVADIERRRREGDRLAVFPAANFVEITPFSGQPSDPDHFCLGKGVASVAHPCCGAADGDSPLGRLNQEIEKLKAIGEMYQRSAS